MKCDPTLKNPPFCFLLLVWKWLVTGKKTQSHYRRDLLEKCIDTHRTQSATMKRFIKCTFGTEMQKHGADSLTGCLGEGLGQTLGFRPVPAREAEKQQAQTELINAWHSGRRVLLIWREQHSVNQRRGACVWHIYERERERERHKSP